MIEITDTFSQFRVSVSDVKSQLFRKALNALKLKCVVPVRSVELLNPHVLELREAKQRLRARYGGRGVETTRCVRSVVVEISERVGDSAGKKCVRRRIKCRCRRVAGCTAQVSDVLAGYKIQVPVYSQVSSP